MCLFRHPTLPILLSHCKLLDGDRGFRTRPCMLPVCIWLGYSCISVPAWRLPTTPSLLAGFPGPCAGADASFLHKKEQTWLDLDLCGSRPTGSKGTSCCQWLSARSISCNPICVSVQCHDPGMQLVLRQLPAGYSNCRCVFFFICLYM